MAGGSFFGQLRELRMMGIFWLVQPPGKLSLRRLSVGDAAALVARISILDSRNSWVVGRRLVWFWSLLVARRFSRGAAMSWKTFERLPWAISLLAILEPVGTQRKHNDFQRSIYISKLENNSRAKKSQHKISDTQEYKRDTQQMFISPKSQTNCDVIRDG